jgi:hypothetical protein
MTAATAHPARQHCLTLGIIPESYTCDRARYKSTDAARERGLQTGRYCNCGARRGCRFVEKERSMLKTVAIVAALCAGVSSVAMAQTYVYSCPAGYALMDGMCQPVGSPGGVVGGAVGAAGAIAGGAVDAAGNIVGGTLGVITGAPPAYGPPYR